MTNQITNNQVYQAIKRYYLHHRQYLTNEEKQQRWQQITKQPHQYNRLWRKMLGLKLCIIQKDMPPPPENRHTIPKQWKK